MAKPQRAKAAIDAAAVTWPLRRQARRGSRWAGSDRYRAMVEHAACGLFQTTEDGRYLAANAALARIYGYDSVDELCGAVTDIGRQICVDPHRRIRFLEDMREHGIISGFESEVRRRDGEVIWISETCREVRDEDGRLNCYEGTVEDITARKRLEDELRQARDKAEAASHAKSIFLAHLSHELRTPLTAIIGFADLIGAYKSKTLPAVYSEYAGLIRASGDKLLTMINDLLDLVATDGERATLRSEPIPLDGLLRRCVEEIAVESAAKRLAIDLTGCDDQIIVEVDQGRLKKAIGNILSNAMKFTPPGGRIVVNAQRSANGAVLISITDNGCGMTRKDVAIAFDLFSQAGALAARRHQGMGIGLALAKAAIELHGGTIGIASELGRGTVVTMQLPGPASSIDSGNGPQLSAAGIAITAAAAPD